MFLQHMTKKGKAAASLAVAFLLCIGIFLSPFGTALAQDIQEDTSSVEQQEPEPPDDSGVVTEPEEPEDPQEPPSEEEEPGDPDAEPERPEFVEQPAYEEAGDIAPDAESEAEIELEFDPQPLDAEDALAQWEQAVEQERTLMWEQEPDAACVPVGFALRFVWVDEEAGVGFWTLAMQISATGLALGILPDAYEDGIPVYNISTANSANIQKVAQALESGEAAIFVLDGTVAVDTYYDADWTQNVGSIELAQPDVTLYLRAKDGQKASILLKEPASNRGVRHINVRAENVTVYLDNVWLDSSEGHRGGVHVHSGGSLNLYGVGNAGLVGGIQSNYNYGRGIRVENGTLVAENIAVKNHTSIISGGGLDVINGRATLTNVVFTGNTAPGGGAISVQGSVSSLVLNSCEISENTATGAASGGGINAVAGTITMVDTLVNRNKGFGAGGGITVQTGGYVEMRGGEVAVNGVNGTNTRGGAVYVNGGTFSMKSGIMYQNQAVMGGAVYVNSGLFYMGGGQIGWEPKRDEWSNNLEKNLGTRGGGVYVNGGVFATRNEGGTEESRPAVMGNESSENAAVYINAGILDMSGARIDGNRGNSGGSLGGGGMLLRIGNTRTQGEYQTRVEDTVFVNNSVWGKSGGAVSVVLETNDNVVLFKNNRFTENYSILYGGAIGVTNASGYAGTLTSGGGNIFDGNVSGYGGSLYISNAGVTLSQGDRILNGESVYVAAGAQITTRPIYFGGAAYLEAGATLTLNGADLQNNIGTNGGGGVYVARGASLIQNSGSISGNATGANADGGGVYVAAGGSFTQNGGSVNENTARLGGGIYLAEASGSTRAEVYLKGGEIAANKNTGGGGYGVYAAKGSYFNLSGSDIHSHTATDRNGAGVMLATGSTGVISGGKIRNNTLVRAGNSVLVATGAGLFVNQNVKLTITGGEISGNSAWRGAGIYVYQGNDISITGLTLKDNTAREMGGGLYVQGQNNISLAAGSKGITISGNKANRGGGLYMEAGDITLAENGGKLQFTGNLATVDGETWGYGGAAFIAAGETTIEGGSFGGNKALGGGAILLSSAKLTITGGSIGEAGNGNTAIQDGAGIYVTGGTLYAGGNGISVAHNTAGRNGGGIYSSYGDIELLKGVSLAQNTATVNGGGLYVDDGVLHMEEAEISGNRAERDGGGAYILLGGRTAGLLSGGDEPFAGPDATGTLQALDKNTISGNSAGRDGGGLFISIAEDGESDSISGNRLTNNTATGNGGGAYIEYYGEGRKIEGNEVSGNRATGHGGGLYIVGTMARYFAITTDKITNNHATGNGGGVFVQDTVFHMYNGFSASVSNNTAGGNGGGIYAEGTAKVVVKTGSISGNVAGGHGGGIYSNVYMADPASLTENTIEWADLLVLVENATVGMNIAGANGGGIYIGRSGGLQLNGATLDANTAAVSGGGVYINLFGHVLVGRGASNAPTVFKGNKANNGDGGGLYVNNGVLEMLHAQFIGNEALKGNGGGSYILLYEALTDSGDDEKGEAQTIAFNLYKENKAQNGGGMHMTVLKGATNDAIAENTFEGNVASADGGGVYLYFEGSGKSVYGNTLKGNEAARGGGIFVTGTPQQAERMALSNDQVLNNTASVAGGGIYVYNSAFTMFDAHNAGPEYKTLDENGVPVEGSKVPDKSPLIQGNSAPNGGGIYLYNSQLLVQRMDVKDNTAGVNGGGIMATGGSTIVDGYVARSMPGSTQVSITGNTATTGDGGGLWFAPDEEQHKYNNAAGGAGILRNYVVQGNTALKDGGGIYVQSSRLNNLAMLNTTFGGGPGNEDKDNRAQSYVPLLTNDTYIQTHISNIRNTAGTPPHSAGDNNTRSAYAYNNYDIAFHEAEAGYATVTFDYTAGYYKVDEKTSANIYYDDVLVGRDVTSPLPRHDDSVFIGWYTDPLTSAKIAAGGGTLVSAQGEYAHTTTTPEEIFYAAWLEAPQVQEVYDNSTRLLVKALDGARAISVAYGGWEADFDNSSIADGYWVVPLPDTLALKAGETIAVTQTISRDGTATNLVASNPAQAPILPTYTLTYLPGADDTTGTVPQDANRYRYGEDARVLGNPGGLARPGYEFNGWRSGNRTLYKADDEITLYEDETLTADWERVYTVTYYANGDSTLDNAVPKDLNEYRSGDKADILHWTPGREGYNFLYWTNEEHGASTDRYISAEADNSGTYKNTYSITNYDAELYAMWQARLTLAYDLNGGVYVGGEITAGEDWYDPGEEVEITREKPTLEGHVFGGWNRYQNYAQDESATMLGGQKHTMTESLTLYAVWYPIYTVSYDGNGNTAGTPPAGDEVVKGGNHVVQGRGDLEKDGHKFGGWALSADAREDYFVPGDIHFVTETVTFYAIWTPVYSVTYRANTGNDTEDGTFAPFLPDDRNQYLAGGEATALAWAAGTPARAGYQFMGWSEDENAAYGDPYYSVGGKLTITDKNVTLYAVWYSIVSVSYNGNGAAGMAPMGQTFTGQGTHTVRDFGTLQMPGKVFIGWGLKDDATEPDYEEGDTLLVTQNVTLYALWDMGYHAYYHANTGSNELDESIVHWLPEEPDARQVGDPIQTKTWKAGFTVPDGYRFVEWNSKADGSGDTYAEGQSYTFGAGNAHFYAIWAPRYKLTYNLNGGSTAPEFEGVTWYDKDATAIVSGSVPTHPSGHKFMGWNLKEEYTEGDTLLQPGKDLTMVQDVALHAVWYPYHTVTYNGNGHTGGDVPNGESVLHGQTHTVEDKGSLVKAGHVFGGWSFTSDGKDDPILAGKELVIMGRTTLYAIWTKVYTLTYNANTGDAALAAWLPQDGENYPANYPVTVQNWKDGFPGRAGYEFLGWSLVAEPGENDVIYSVESPGNVLIITGEHTLHAVWKAIPPPTTPKVEKTANVADGAKVKPGDEITYKLTITNENADEVEIEVVDTLPAGLTHKSSSHDGEAQGQVVTWKLTVPNGETEITVTATVDDGVKHGATLVNRVTVVLEGEEEGEEDNHKVEVDNPPTTPKVEKSADVADGAKVKPGDEITYKLTITNDNADEVEIEVVDTLPAGLTHKSSSHDGKAQGQVVTWKLTVPTGETEITVTATVDGGVKHGATLVNRVTVVLDGEEEGEEDNHKVEVDNPDPPPTPTTPKVEKSADVADGAKVKPGDEITYKLTITNENAEKVEIEVVDTLPAGLTHKSSSHDGKAQGQVVTWKLEVQPGKTEIEVTATVDGNVKHGATLANRVTVVLEGEEEGEEDNHKVEVDNPDPPPTPTTPTVEKTANVADGAKVKPGDEITYKLTITNENAEKVEIEVVDTLPAGLTHKSSSHDGEAQGQVVTWKLEVQPGKTEIEVTATVDGNVKHGATLVNRVTVVLEGEEEGEEDDHKVEVDNPDPPPTPTTPTVEKTANVADGAKVKPGDEITYKLTITNENADKVEIEVVDTLPAGLSHKSSSHDGEAQGQVVTWKLEVQPGKTEIEVTATVDGNVKHGATLVNRVTVVLDGEEEGEEDDHKVEVDNPDPTTAPPTTTPPTTRPSTSKPSTTRPATSRPDTETPGEPEPEPDSSEKGGTGASSYRPATTRPAGSSSSTSARSSSSTSSGSSSSSASSSEQDGGDAAPGDGDTGSESNGGTTAPGGTDQPTEGEPLEAEDEEELNYVWTWLFGESVPVGSFRAYGTWSLLNLVCAVLGTLVAVLLAAGALVRRKRGQQHDAPDEGQARKHSMILRIVAILTGILLPVLFLILENLAQPMALLNHWTPWMLAVLVVHLLATLLYKLVRRRNAAQQEPEEPEYQ